MKNLKILTIILILGSSTTSFANSTITNARVETIIDENLIQRISNDGTTTISGKVGNIIDVNQFMLVDYYNHQIFVISNDYMNLKLGEKIVITGDLNADVVKPNSFIIQNLAPKSIIEVTPVI